MSGARARRNLGAALVCALALPAIAPAHAAPATHAPATRSRAPARAAAPRGKPATRAQIQDLARNARTFEEVGAYRRAATALRALSLVVPPDADLDLALVLDLARSGSPDSAAALLSSPLVASALVDTLPVTRRHLYPWEREPLWINGRFDGWSWYAARTLAEVSAQLGRWHDARIAASACVAARPLAGVEWLIEAIAAGRDAQPGLAVAAANQAALLDPTLPEAQYLVGLYEWKAGRVMSAQRRFRAAVALDSTWRPPALALVRSRLPGVPPDSLPAEFLTGVRAAGLLTSAVRPKLEEFVQTDEPAVILRRGAPAIPDSLATSIPEMELSLPVLVDERGRAVLNMLPWLPAELPPGVVSAIIGSLNDWRFKPAKKNGAPQRTWQKIDYRTAAAPPAGGGTH